MDTTFWHKQNPSQPLFPDLIWSRPVNRANAGKLLVAGGNQHGFSAISYVFGAVDKAGVGHVRLLLPDSLRKVVGDSLPNTEFAPSTYIGSFSQKALDSLLDLSNWADAVLLAGDFGHNSETAATLEKFIMKYSDNLTVAGDAVDVFMSNTSLLSRKNTLLVITPSQLRKLGINTKYQKAFVSDPGLLQFVDILHDFSEQFGIYIATLYQDMIVLTANGQVSTTPWHDPHNWMQVVAARSTVWWLQNKAKPFESITTSLIF